MLFYYCDESFDEDVYTVAGLVAEDAEWGRFGKRWHHIPKKFGVSRFHASPLNRKDHEFKGWSDSKRRKFTRKLIQSVTERKMALVSCSVMRKPYAKLPQIARTRLGSPYELCFKHCITAVAEHAVPFLDPNGQFSVIYDRNTEVAGKAKSLFTLMQDDKKWAHRHKLVTCDPGSWEQFLPLQPADMVAYDTFKLLHQASWDKTRISLRKILEGTHHIGVCFDEEVFNKILPRVLATEGTVIVDPALNED